MNSEHELLHIERQLWTNDATIYEETYLPDAVLIFPEVGRIDRNAAVAAIREENAAGRHWANVDFSMVTVLTVAPQAALLIYQARARWNDEEAESKTLCSTVYVKRNDRWRIALHQQTAA